LEDSDRDDDEVNGVDLANIAMDLSALTILTFFIAKAASQAIVEREDGR
jgi:hypothetical protein